MAIRLGAATMVVVILAYFVGPVVMMCGMIAAGVLVVWNHGTLEPQDE